MSLRDVMSGAGMSHFAQIALVVFVATFAMLVIWVFTRSRSELDREARLPLDDAPSGATRTHNGSSSE